MKRKILSTAFQILRSYLFRGHPNLVLYTILLILLRLVSVSCIWKEFLLLRLALNILLSHFKFLILTAIGLRNLSMLRWFLLALFIFIGVLVVEVLGTSFGSVVRRVFKLLLFLCRSTLIKFYVFIGVNLSLDVIRFFRLFWPGFSASLIFPITFLLCLNLLSKLFLFVLGVVAYRSVFYLIIVVIFVIFAI